MLRNKTYDFVKYFFLSSVTLWDCHNVFVTMFIRLKIRERTTPPDGERQKLFQFVAYSRIFRKTKKLGDTLIRWMYSNKKMN